MFHWFRFTSSLGERQVHIAQEDIFPAELGWALNPGCPYRATINAHIRSLMETGLIAKVFIYFLIIKLCPCHPINYIIFWLMIGHCIIKLF